MRDIDVRKALHKQALAEHHNDPDSLVLDEFGLNRGAVLADVVVINGTIHGFEIKSDRDNLDRLPRQADAYGSTLDHATLVVHRRHLDRAMGMVPGWWGVILAEEAEGEVCFREVREARPNPGRDSFSLALLLWRDEALAVLDQRGLARGLRGRTRAVLCRHLADFLTLEQLGEVVRTAIKRREGWRVDAPRT
jgi:hypothetical protein